MADQDLKIYTSEVIEDMPFPEQSGEANLNSSSGKSGDTYTAEKISDQPLPSKKVAHELLSQALNTRSRKVLAEFQFTEMGAIQIGKFQNGVSGDIRISPNGIVGRDSSGNTTFALDGETGDAIFKGKLMVGSLIAEDANIVTERAGSGNGRMVWYNGGLPSIIIGDPS